MEEFEQQIDEQSNSINEQPEQPVQVEQPEQSEMPNADVEQTDEKKAKRSRVFDKVINVLLVLAVITLVLSVFFRGIVFSTVGVQQSSMFPTLQSGNNIVVNKLSTPKRGDIVVFYKGTQDKEDYTFKEKLLDSFNYYNNSATYTKLVKRVIAVGGDKMWLEETTDENGYKAYTVWVESADGNLYTENRYTFKGQPVSIPLMYSESTITQMRKDGINKVTQSVGVLEGCTRNKPYVVEKGYMFTMGDNRDVSQDSRYYGCFKISSVFGVVID